jgi:predicted transcriptional regulator
MKQDIRPAQLRAARALIGWSRERLALEVDLTERTIARIEDADTSPRQSTLAAIRTALEAAGVIFIDQNGEGPGVRLKKDKHNET